MSAEDTKDKQAEGGGKAIFSGIGLILALVALVYAAPKLNALFGSQKEDTPDSVGNVKAVQAPQELSSWIPLIEEQLPEEVDTKYRLIHARLSEDGDRLLLDLEIETDGEKERVDCVLEKDEFGRFISDNDAIPMKLYPPVEGESEKADAE